MELSKTGGMLQKKDIFMSLDIIVLIKKKIIKYLVFITGIQNPP